MKRSDNSDTHHASQFIANLPLHNDKIVAYMTYGDYSPASIYGVPLYCDVTISWDLTALWIVKEHGQLRKLFSFDFLWSYFWNRILFVSNFRL